MAVLFTCKRRGIESRNVNNLGIHDAEDRRLREICHQLMVPETSFNQPISTFTEELIQAEADSIYKKSECKELVPDIGVADDVKEHITVNDIETGEIEKDITESPQSPRSRA